MTNAPSLSPHEVDVCWKHSYHNVTGKEYCTKGVGSLVFEAIEEFLCPDSSQQGILGVAVDTTVPNIPWSGAAITTHLNSFSMAAEPTKTSNTSSNWLRLYGKAAETPTDWDRWEATRHPGKRCRQHANFGWSTAKLGPITLDEAVKLCAGNSPILFLTIFFSMVDTICK